MLQRVRQKLEFEHRRPHSLAFRAAEDVHHIQTSQVVVERTLSHPERVGGNRVACRAGVGRESTAGRLVEGRLGSTRQLMDL